MQVRVVDSDGAVLPEGSVGTVECRGPSMMEGYLDQADATAKVLRDGWLDTGDLGFTCRGELFIAGRAKDILLLRGRNYPPEEVEQAAEAVPGVRAGCVVAVTWLPEGADTERLLVLAEARRDLPAAHFGDTASAIAAAILSASGLVADRVVILAPGTLPRTSSGKLRRGDTLRLFLSGKLEPPEPVTRARLAAALLRSWTKRRLRLRQ
jgi:acyl-CoA synthetase (AMP-forming)/AMP-acid ligase II